MKLDKIAFLALTTLGFLSVPTSACLSAKAQQMTQKAVDAVLKKYSMAKRTPASTNAGGMPILPINWGGGGAKNSEAVLANLVSEEFNKAYKSSDTADVIVALPAKLRHSGFRPFGDEQRNAALSFGSWTHGDRPPFYAVLITDKDGDRKISFHFHPELKAGDTATISYSLGGIMMTTEQDIENNRVGWNVPSKVKFGSFHKSQPIFVKPTGWQDWFVLDFRFPHLSVDELKKNSPTQTLPDKKRSLIDPAMVSSQEGATDDNLTPFGRLMSKNFKPESGYNWPPYPSANVHAEMPKEPMRAVGEAWTWVLEKPHGPFKMMYSCFQERQSEHGVPTGTGWHEIGNDAETILNTLENSPLIVGYANGHPVEKTPSGVFSYGLSDVVQVRFLKPGEAQITSAGPTTLQEIKDNKRGEGGSTGGRNFHWFLFHFSSPACMELWVHECVPSESNNLGLRCK